MAVTGAGLLALLLAGAAWAQNGRPAPQPQRPAPAGNALAGASAEPPAANAPASIQPANARQNGPTGNRPIKEGKVVLAFNDVEFTETIPFIVESTGKVVIPVNLAALKPKRITLMNDQPVERAAALDLLFTAMRLNGIGIIETDEIVILDSIDNIRANELPVLSAQDDVLSLQNRGQLIVKIFRLREAKVESISDQLQEKIPEYANLIAEPNSNQFILYGDVGLAQHMQLLINELDRNHVIVKTQTFRLDYADAQLVADQIIELFQDEEGATAGQPRPPRQQGGRNQQRGNQPGAAPTAAGVTPGPPVPLRVSVNVQQNSVTVSAEPVKIDAIAKLIAEDWDLPRPEDTAKVYMLEYTDPLKVVELLEGLLGTGGGPTTPGRVQGGAQGRAGQAGGQGGAGGSISQAIGDIYRIEAYPDQNMIVVLSKTKDALYYLDYIIESIDQPSTIGLPHVVELKHANAVELANELNILLAEAGSGGGLDAPQTGLTGEGIGGVTDQGGASDTGGGATGGGGGGGATSQIEFPWQRGRPRDDQSEPSSLIGKVRIVPIIRQNALAILAPVAQRHSVIELIRDFDRPGRQVMISAVIAEVELTDDFAFGLRFSSEELVSTASDNALRGGIDFAGTQNDIFDSLFDTSVLDVDAHINVLLEALRQKTNVRILQEPRVFTADNHEAIFFDGQDVPFITQSNTSDISGFQQNFEYQAVGVQIDVRPRITAERDVDMEINLELSSIVPGETLFGGAILDRRETTTKVIVKNGQTIVLSGILTDSESSVKRGLPLLSELPLIGDLFASHSTNKITTELVAFITPVVVDNPTENDKFNEGARERLKELSKPLKEQNKKRKDIRERIVDPKARIERMEQGAGDDNDEDQDNDQEMGGDPSASEPRRAPIDIDDLSQEPE